jgi:hypothetical protein
LLTGPDDLVVFARLFFGSSWLARMAVSSANVPVVVKSVVGRYENRMRVEYSDPRKRP